MGSPHLRWFLSRWRLGCVFMVMIAVYTLFAESVPLIGDDFLFIYKYHLASGGTDAFSLSSYLAYARDIWLYENGRLSNMLCAFMVLHIPHIIWSLILALVITLTVFMGTRLVMDSRRMSLLALLAVWTGCILLLPWCDMLMSIDFALNYFFPGLFVVLAIYGGIRLGRGNSNAVATCMWGLAGFVAGWFHESFGVPLCFGFAAVGLRHRLHMPLQWWVIALCVFVGSAISTFSPALLERAGAISVGFTPRYAMLLARSAVKFYPMVVLGLFLAAVCLTSRKGRLLLRSLVWSNDLMIYLCIAAVASACIGIFTLAPVRGSYLASLCVVLVIVSLAVRYLRMREDIADALIWIWFSLIVAFYCGVIYWQNKVREDDAKAWTSINNSTNGQGLYDPILSTPWYTLQHVVAGYWHGRIQTLGINYESGENFIHIVPSVFRNMEFDKLCVIPNMPFMRQYGPYLVTDDFDSLGSQDSNLNRELGMGYINLRYVLSDGTIVGSPGNIITYIDNSGRTFYVVIPLYTDKVKGPYRDVLESRYL